MYVYFLSYFTPFFHPDDFSQKPKPNNTGTSHSYQISLNHDPRFMLRQYLSARRIFYTRYLFTLTALFPTIAPYEMEVSLIDNFCVFVSNSANQPKVVRLTVSRPSAERSSVDLQLSGSTWHLVRCFKVNGRGFEQEIRTSIKSPISSCIDGVIGDSEISKMLMFWSFAIGI